jgi:DNA-binding NtrC family response regulator
MGNSKNKLQRELDRRRGKILESECGVDVDSEAPAEGRAGSESRIDVDRLQAALRDVADDDKIWSLLEATTKEEGIESAFDAFLAEHFPVLTMLVQHNLDRLRLLLDAALDKEGSDPVLRALAGAGAVGGTLLMVLDTKKFSRAVHVAIKGEDKEETEKALLKKFFAARDDLKRAEDFRQTYGRDALPRPEDWLLPELVKRPSRLFKFYEAKFPERMKAFASIIGSGDAMCLAKNLAALAAESEYGVLLLGESGTGKELFASAIHDNSVRKDGPFVPVNCAAIPHELFEGEMFGVEKGAFTHATPRMGFFRQADRGTILLDEIGECRLDNQTKLLRALQPSANSGPCQLKVRPVGGKEDEDIDVRVIAGTNRNLAEMVRQNLFRSDLYYRLATLTLKLPPLQDRGSSDIRQLAGMFWDGINEQLAKASSNYRPKKLDESAYARLVEHSWPGNVRELQNVLRQVAVTSVGMVVDRNAINAAIAEMPQDSTAGPFRRERGPEFSLPTRLEQMERIFVEDALKACDWIPNRAYKLLGLNSATALRKKMKQLKIEQPTKD